jgi:murein DD-endopeptidase MepM/ murein hydrolase activator NlpD
MRSFSGGRIPVWAHLARRFVSFIFAFGFSVAGYAQGFSLPTPNDTLFKGGGDAFFVGTTGKPWTSGRFGCVRSEGQQMHEGIDIRCQQRDPSGEPIDPVYAVAEGVIVYANQKPGLSNYGRYLVLRHRIEGLELYTLYAHLREIRAELVPGTAVQRGQRIATLGRSTNTREGISRERAHLHFEFNLLMNERFAEWFKRQSPAARNDHSLWNGQNFVGLNPEEVFLAQLRRGNQFSFLQHVREQTELCRVWVPDLAFPWLRRYPLLIRKNPVAEREGIAGFEVAFNYAGLPYQLIPRARSEVVSPRTVRLLSVNETEANRHSCRRLLTRKTGRWELTGRGTKLIDLLVY